MHVYAEQYLLLRLSSNIHILLVILLVLVILLLILLVLLLLSLQSDPIVSRLFLVVVLLLIICDALKFQEIKIFDQSSENMDFQFQLKWFWRAEITV